MFTLKADLGKAVPTEPISYELVAKFAMAEELRLVTTKIDRLMAYIEGRILLPEEVTRLVKILDASRIAVVVHEKSKIKKRRNCDKKKPRYQAIEKSPLAKREKPSLSLWGRLKRFWTESLHPFDESVD